MPEALKNFIDERQARSNSLLMRRQLRTSEIVDMTIEALRRLGWGYFRESALPTLYCVAVFYFLTNFVLADLFTTQAGASINHQFVELSIRIGVVVFIGAPLLVLGISYLFALATFLVAEWASGQIPDSAAAARRARQSLPAVARSVFREVFITAGGYVLCLAILFGASVVPQTSESLASTSAALGMIGIAISSVILWYRWVASSLVVPVVVLENLRGGAATKRSRYLLGTSFKGMSTNITGNSEVIKLMVTLFFLEFSMSLGIDALESTVGLNATILRIFGPGLVRDLLKETIAFSSTFFVLWIALGFGAVGRAVLYFERRIKLEGLDIELLAQKAERSQQRLSPGGVRFEL